MTEIIDAEIIEEPGTELVHRATAQVGLFGTDQPAQIIEKATQVADVLKGVVVKQGLAKRIGTSEYILVEGWTTLGNLVGVFPKVEWTRPISGDDPGWEAAVVVVNAHGVEIGRAEAQCLRSERNWKGRDDFALRSMAQTRAMGKALRMPLGWIATLAGYEATPAEEMPNVQPEPSKPEPDDIPFDHAAPATPSPEEQWVADQETAAVDAVVELARQVDAATLKTTKKAIADHRKKFDGKVDPTWLGKLRAALEDKRTIVVVPDVEQESAFKAPAGAVK